MAKKKKEKEYNCTVIMTEDEKKSFEEWRAKQEAFAKWEDELRASEKAMMDECGYVEKRGPTFCSYCGRMMMGYLEMDICSGCLEEWGHD